ncbi:MAG: SdpI family protein [Firmicutes bacterium]|nr:SdpI family protein [Bacillota bacterium]
MVVFFVIVDIILPCVMIAFGHRFLTNPPKKINRVYGYRTKMSMLNQDTWNFAHGYLGKLWKQCGMLMIIPSAFIVLLASNDTNRPAEIVGLVVLIVQVVILLITVGISENALKNTFRKDGSRCRKSLDDFPMK